MERSVNNFLFVFNINFYLVSPRLPYDIIICYIIIFVYTLSLFDSPLLSLFATERYKNADSTRIKFGLKSEIK